MYDIIIIGAGPAGLTAGIYGARANKKILILDKMGIGGQVALTNDIKNYPGFNEISGFELAEKMKKQVLDLGVEIKREEVKSVDLSADLKIVKTHKNEYTAKAVIIATGAYAKPLDVSNEREFLGKGLSYCATCDGNFFKNKVVAVVGGGNTSFEDCLYLSNLAKKVYLIHRREAFRGTECMLSQIKALSVEENAKIEIITNSVVTKLIGQDRLEQIQIFNKQTEQLQTLSVDGIFVAIGRKPDTEIFSSILKMNENGFIKTNSNMHTNIKNVYACGDVRETPLRQIITACADGAIAVTNIIQNL